MGSNEAPGPGRLLIDGTWRDAVSGRTFDTINPADETVITQVAEASAPDVDAAVMAARKAFESGAWPKMGAPERARILWRMGELIRERTPTLAVLETPRHGEDALRFRQDRASVRCGDLPVLRGCDLVDRRSDASGAPGRVSLSRCREPVGVVAAIVPWNFPFLLASWKVAPALAAGCAVIVKPASQTPLTAIELGRIGLEAGLPPGVLQILPGSGSGAGMALVRHPGVDKIAFTGSTEVGRRSCASPPRR